MPMHPQPACLCLILHHLTLLLHAGYAAPWRLPHTSSLSTQQDIIVRVAGVGNTIVPADNAPVTFEFIDLWSRKSTWGGLDPPVEGDSVILPAGE